MMRALALLFIVCAATVARADDTHRKVAVLEYRAGSSALVGIGTQLATEIGKQTSLVVLGPQQARTVYGEQLESAIVKCGGEADCIAKIGNRLQAAEVILVGVSELGDVILTMQRINVSSHAVTARIADSLGNVATPTAKQLNDYLQRLLPPADFIRFGIIDIIANEPNATVTVGGERRGTTPIDPLKLRAPATYAIRVEKSGFVPFTTKVQLPPDAELKVEAELSRRGAVAWYQHWYVLAGLGLVVAGAAGTTIYFATRDEATGLTFDGSIQ
jgi:hypothetical protein